VGETVAAKALEYNDDLHPHKPAGPGGGQFASTNGGGSSGPTPRGRLTPSGQRQGNPRRGRGGAAAKPSGWIMPTTTLKKGGNNDPKAVKQLQYLINELKLGGILADGNYGDSTEQAVKALQTRLGLKPTGTASPSLLKRLKDVHTLSPCVDRGASQVAAAAGHDVTPGHDELHHYWTRGKGLARWATSPTPWTTLVALLSEHVSPEKARVFASRWYIEVFKYAAGSDLARVAHGKPPRGQVVGPG
jgi:peptidoglycan hydrolase-like protein with peptidoglycan-binding domain